MPITKPVTVEELLGELVTLDRSAVVTAMQSSAQPLFQVVFDKGHAAAVARLTPEKTALEAKIATLEGQLTEKDKDILKLSEKAPDLAKLTSDHATAIATLEGKHKTQLDTLSNTLKAERMERAERDFVSVLKDKGVDAEYAEVVLNQAKRTQRLRHNDKGTVEAFRADVEAAFAPTDKKSGIALLADELFSTVPKKMITVNGDAGAGTSTGPGTGTAKGKDLYKRQREDVKAKESESSSTGTARDRLAGVRPAAASA